MIFLENIYSQSIGLFDDPSITSAYNTNPILFFQTMHMYYQNAVPRFNNPFIMQPRLALSTAPQGQLETFSGNGTAIYHLSTTPIANSYFNYVVNNSVVSGNYDYSGNTVTFSVSIPVGQTGSCEWYYTGAILPDLQENELDPTAQNILARLIVVCWSEKEKNFLLDIRRLLNDTDFKLASEANSLRSKGGWYTDMCSAVASKMNQYAWGLQYQHRFNVGHY